MRKTIIVGLFLIIGLGMANAQDVITKRNGEDISAKILEVTQSEIKYKKFDNQTGPTFTIALSDIFMVKYENGSKDVFDKVPQQGVAYNTGNRSMPVGVVPDMAYKEYKNLYKNRRYIPQAGDQYNPAIAGVCSFLVPGLGQVICGEVGRGLGYFGGTVGCYVVMGVAANLSASEDISPELGTALVLTAAAGSLTYSICSIVDAVKVAKIKNMYEQDLRKMTTSSIDLTLSPYIDVASIGGQKITPVGLTLSVSF